MNLNDVRDSAEYKLNNYKSREIMSNIYIGDCIRELTEQFKEINKNLEKISNNTEKVHTTGYMRTELNKGEFYGPPKRELNLDTIICKQNKDSHVDKNIILD